MTFPQSSAYPEQSQATTILVLGILGVICCVPFGIAAWVMGNRELEAIDAGRRNPENRGSANAGKILGIVSVALWVIGAVAFALLFVAGVSLTAFDSL